MPLTLFITGASGYIGSIVTSRAINAGHTVHALSRTPSSDTYLSSLGAVPVRGDLSTHDVLTREASRADVVINLADSIAGRIGEITHEERFRINEEAVRALAKGVEGWKRKLILTSGTLFTGADPNGLETDETAPPWENSPFGTGMEGSYKGLKDRGINVNVVRLAPWVYGRGGSGVKLFMQGAAMTGNVGYVGDGNKRTTTIHVDDAARLYLLVAQRAPAGEIYNATSETDVTFKSLAQAMGEVMGVPVVKQKYEDVEEKTGELLANFLCSENRASSGKARRELGWTIEAERGILKEIVGGSYVELAEELKKVAV